MFQCRRRHRHNRESLGAKKLSELSEGATVRVISFLGGRKCREKMSSMGIFPGTDVKVEKAEGEQGMILISIGSVRIMLDSMMASRILIEKVG